MDFAPSVDIKPPRLADAPWALECKTWQVINVKDDRQLIIGEGLRFHIRDELWDPKAMRVYMDKYHPIGRMSPTATAVQMIASSFRQPKGQRRPTPQIDHCRLRERKV